MHLMTVLQEFNEATVQSNLILLFQFLMVLIKTFMGMLSITQSR
jgi:hypothetical protein